MINLVEPTPNLLRRFYSIVALTWENHAQVKNIVTEGYQRFALECLKFRECWPQRFRGAEKPGSNRPFLPAEELLVNEIRGSSKDKERENEKEWLKQSGSGPAKMRLSHRLLTARFLAELATVLRQSGMIRCEGTLMWAFNLKPKVVNEVSNSLNEHFGIDNSISSSALSNQKPESLFEIAKRFNHLLDIDVNLEGLNRADKEKKKREAADEIFRRLRQSVETQVVDTLIDVFMRLRFAGVSTEPIRSATEDKGEATFLEDPCWHSLRQTLRAANVGAGVINKSGEALLKRMLWLQFLLTPELLNYSIRKALGISDPERLVILPMTLDPESLKVSLDKDDDLGTPLDLSDHELDRQCQEIKSALAASSYIRRELRPTELCVSFGAEVMREERWNLLESPTYEMAIPYTSSDIIISASDGRVNCKVMKFSWDELHESAQAESTVTTKIEGGQKIAIAPKLLDDDTIVAGVSYMETRALKKLRLILARVAHKAKNLNAASPSVNGHNILLYALQPVYIIIIVIALLNSYVFEGERPWSYYLLLGLSFVNVLVVLIGLLKKSAPRLVWTAQLPLLTLFIILALAFSSDHKAAQAAGELRRKYALLIQQAEQLQEGGSIKEAKARLEEARLLTREANLRGFEWHYLWRSLNLSTEILPANSEIDVMAISADGRKIATKARNGGIEIYKGSGDWKTPFSNGDRGMRDSKGETLSLAFSPDPDCRWLIVGTRLGDIWRREIASGKEQKIAEVPKDARIHAIAWAPNGKTFITAGEGGNAHLRDAVGWKHFKSLPGIPRTKAIKAVAWTPDSRYVATGSDDGLVRIWEGRSGKLRSKLLTGSGVVLSTAFSPDGKHLAVGTSGGKLHLWQFNSNQRRPPLLAIPNIEISAVAFSANGKYLAAGGSDGNIWFWDIKDIERDRFLTKTRSGVGKVTQIFFSPDSQRLIARTSGDTRSWDVAQMLDVPVFESDHKGSNPKINTVAFSPDGKQLAVGDRNLEIRLWDMRARVGTPLSVRKAGLGRRDEAGVPEGMVWEIEYSPDGKILAAAVCNKVLLYDPFNEKVERRMLPVRDPSSPVCEKHSIRSLSFSPDGKFIAIGKEDGEVSLIDVNTGEVKQHYAGHAKARQPVMIESIAFSPNGKIFASGDRDGNVKLWDASTGHETKTTPIATFTTSGQALALALRFSHDGKMLAASGGSAIGLWDTSSWRHLGDLKGHSDSVNSVVFSHDDRRIFTGGKDKLIKIWDAETRNEVLTLRGHYDQIWGIALSNDGYTLASGSWDGTARIWMAAMGQ